MTMPSSVIEKFRRLVLALARFAAPLCAAVLVLASLPAGAAAISYPLSFNTGWTLSGNSLTAPIDVKTVFGGQSAIRSVWRWDTATGNWAFYAPSLDAAGSLASYAASKGYSVLATISQGQGYWVNASAPVTLATQSGTALSLAATNLVTGWNLAATGDEVTASTLAGSLGNVTTLWAWDNATDAWYFHAPVLAADNSQAGYIQSKGYKDFGSLSLGKGRGFWINYAGATATTFTPSFVRIPGGSFSMGDHFDFVDPDHPSDEIPLHNVTISAFYMSATLVTNAEYAAYLNTAIKSGLIEVRSGIVYAVGGTNAFFYTTSSVPLSTISYANNSFTVRSGRELHPVTGVRWFGAAAFANWLSTRDGYTPCYDLTTGACDLTGNGYRLPTEAEWEKAARGGLSGKRFPWGDTISQKLANYYAVTASYSYDLGPDGYNAIGSVGGTSQATSPVGSFAANGYGLNDMAGNVSQWCWDWYGSPYAGGTDPRGAATGSRRVNRGGGWGYSADYCRAAVRNISSPTDGNLNRGFRSVLPPGQ